MTEQLCGGAVFRTPEGSIILQLRENKPGIAKPGMVHVFGGNAEPGESGVEAMLREVVEETGIDPVKLATARHIGTILEYQDGTSNIVEMFLIDDCPETELQVLEGDGHVLIDEKTDLDSLPITPLARTVLRSLRPSVMEARE